MRLLAAALLFAVLAAAEVDEASVRKDLDSIARTASVMVDGDVCERIVTPRARQYILANPSRDKWADADNYDTNEAAFIATKKTLIRLSRLATYPVDVNLWMPLKPDLSLVHIVIRNRYEMSQFWPWGKLTQPAPPVMQEVLRTGERRTVTDQSGYISVLAPVRNSLGDIVGLAEAVTKIPLNPRENVQ